MSLINLEEEDNDSWLSELSALERLSDQISKHITDRDSKNSANEYNKISARVRIQLKQFENEYTHLDKKLQILFKNKKLTSDEKERRYRKLEHLASKKTKLDSRFQNTASSSTRTQLFEAAKNKLYEDDEPILNNNTNTSVVEDFRTQQKQIIKVQDDSLDNLSKVIARQKNIAIRIGTEVDNQNEILEDLSTQMDATNSRVNSTTQNVNHVAEKDSTWGYWIVIISLFVAIILVGIL